MARLQILLPDAPAIDRELTDEPITMGRVADNLLQIEEGSISSHHAEIIPQENGGHLLRDLDSTNGTYVNGEQIQEALLNDGDSIRLGKVEARYFAQDAAPATPGGDSLQLPVDTPFDAGKIFADVSVRPIDFHNSSPFAKTIQTKDPIRLAALALGAIALLGALAALGATFGMLEVPTFPAP